MLLDRNDNPKLRKTDIEVVLRPADGKKALGASSIVDPRLFTGGNSLRVVQNPTNRLWAFKYSFGMIPEALKQRFTSADDAITFAKTYFKKRNIDVVEVKD